MTPKQTNVANKPSRKSPSSKIKEKLIQKSDSSNTVNAAKALDASDKLLKRGIHPTAISDSFQLNLEDRETLIKAAATSLNSKVVSQHSSLLAPIAVDAVLKVHENNNVDLRDIKSILRDALNEMAIHFFNKAKIAVVRDVEREDIEFILQARSVVGQLLAWTISYRSFGNLLTWLKKYPMQSLFVFHGISAANANRTVNVVIRGSNKLVLEEADRSLHDALCVIRCLVIKPALIPGGGFFRN
ncbi:hypothetical protein RDWZM_009525 [Blomia tropicalis]|uniref:Uncharacterized protein n=1 Tax=Blomia tropicalis TaxID=40697 RepID=A0A9Q0M483_BLOTA|nr:hypothetical protein RDWZM_009525 [Blomia tropicalis]